MMIPIEDGEVMRDLSNRSLWKSKMTDNTDIVTLGKKRKAMQYTFGWKSTIALEIQPLKKYTSGNGK